MGRTIKPVRYEVEAQLQELRSYLNCLRKEDREAFERLSADIKKHISAITYANPLDPGELMQWSALLELEKELKKVKDEVDRCIQGEG